MKKVNDNQALNLAKRLKVRLNLQDHDYNKGIPFSEWKYGIEVELEHGSELGENTNVTNDDLLATARIALAHFKEFPDYYRHLKLMEEKLEREWERKNKPCIINCPGSNNTKVTADLLGSGIVWATGGKIKYKSKVQSVLVPKKAFKSKQAAANWVKKHKQFHVEKIDTTKNYYRFRQKSPKGFDEFRTITIYPKKKIKAVIGLKLKK